MQIKTPSTHLVAAASCGLLIGVLSGSLVASEPVVRTPSACAAMVDAVAEIDDIQMELLDTAVKRGDAVDTEKYRVLDAEARHLAESIADVEGDYAGFRAICLGDS